MIVTIHTIDGDELTCHSDASRDMIETSLDSRGGFHGVILSSKEYDYESKPMITILTHAIRSIIYPNDGFR